MNIKQANWMTGHVVSLATSAHLVGLVINNTKIEEFVCPPNISQTVAVRTVKLAHRPRIASTTIKLISKPLLLSILWILLNTIKRIRTPGTPTSPMWTWIICCCYIWQINLYYIIFSTIAYSPVAQQSECATDNRVLTGSNPTEAFLKLLQFPLPQFASVFRKIH